MVERFNRTLLQLLCSYTEQQEEWERYLPVLFTYRTAVHTSMGVSPNVWVSTSTKPFHTRTACDTVPYQSQLRIKLAQLSIL